MKNLYLFALVLITHLSFSQNFTDTKGELQISASGTAVYNLPIATPPSIKSVAPIINLTYTSGVRGGIAGQGWNINSISAVMRIATRRDIDGFVDGVDFDDNDKLALDGQRLLLKTGTYWANGSTYETEYKSNTRIELKIEGITTYFIVTAPDGSRSWYGSRGSGSLQNSVSLNAWYIVHFEDVNANFIDYNYKTLTYNGSNQLYIDTITFSGNATMGIAAQNKISFTYRDSKRIERDYIKGVPVYANKILENIEVYANNSLFRTYRLSHIEDKELGYERIERITEINAQKEESNPVVFKYTSSPNNQERTEKLYINKLDFAKTDLTGDFDGDGRLDFVVNNQVFTNLFKSYYANEPIVLPFTIDNRFVFTATTLTSAKLNQFNSIVKIEVASGKISFKNYKLVNNSFTNDFTKTILLNNAVVATDQYSERNLYNEDPYYVCGEFNCYPLDPGFSTNYTEGDFNGDGISEVLIEHFDNERVVNDNVYITHSQGSCNTCSRSYDNSGSSFYLLDLNPNTSTDLNSKGFHKINNMDSSYSEGNIVTGTSYNKRKFVADFDGDGKSDILIINYDKTYKIISFKQLSIAPWAEVEILGTGTLDKYSWTKQILFGDYNGDGKADIMLPDSEGGEGQVQWHIYYSNANPAGGEFFTKESHNIVEYRPDTTKEGKPYKTQADFSNYYAIDINGDGKSDLVRVWRKYYKNDWSINNHDTQWQVTGFYNNIGKVGASGFTPGYDSGVFTSPSPDIPIPVTSNYRYKGANTDLVIVRGHSNQIEYYQFNKNADTENRLLSVTESSGNIKQTIEYKTMEALDSGLGDAYKDFYSSSNSVNYPNFEIIRNSKSYLVSKLTATINGISKYQDFRYRGFVSNFDYGTIGFIKTSRSSWYLNDADTKIWTTEYKDVALKGANTITWTSTNGPSVFLTIPSNLLTTKTNEFTVYTAGSTTAPSNSVYNVLLTKKTIIDHLSDTKTETIFTYDGTVESTNYFALETKSVTKQFSGSTLEGTTTVDTQYDNNPTGVAASYFVGRPKKVNTATVIYTGDTRTSEETYTYTGSNLTKTEKKGHNTYAIIEDMSYDSLGNLLTKTVSAPGAPTPPVSRTITDEYDSSKRFVVKKKDHQGFVTNFVYNTLGQVTQSTDYTGVISSYSYDNWGKLKNTTVQNAASTPLITSVDYNKLADGGYTTTITNNTDAKTITQYDVLGREVITTTKGFTTGSMVSRQVVYDALGKKTKVSEPYFNSPNQWTFYEYDYLMRPVKVTAHTGKIQTLSYSGLTTTCNDDGKITTVTINSLSYKTKTTDPGGAVYFKYYANGQLQESDYNGNIVSNLIDGWGNKTSMKDPSAGTYTYSYDAFGQIKTETTPNGTITYQYDDVGRTAEKTIKDTNTNSKTFYIYNAYNLITSSSLVNNLEGTTTTNTFEYDNYQRIRKTVENTPYAIFTKELSYDEYGRRLTETSSGLIASLGKSSSKKIRYTYQNGYAWQILDDATQQVLWQVNTVNERGQLLTAQSGPTTITKTYDIYGFPSQFKYDKTSNAANILNLNMVFEPNRGNLTSRKNNSFNLGENYSYDVHDRLTTMNDARLPNSKEYQIYDDQGRITKNYLGTYDYKNIGKPYQNSAITLTDDGLNYYINRGEKDKQGSFSDDMETGTGWSMQALNLQCISFDTSKAHSGNNSLRIKTVDVNASNVLCDSSLNINNSINTAYTFSGWVYTDGPVAELNLSGYSVTTAEIGKWTYISKTITIPVNVENLRLRVGSTGKGNVWFDDVQLYRADTPPLRRATVTADSFSDNMESRTGWSTLPQSPQCISFDNTKSHTGNNSIKVNTVDVNVSHVLCDTALNINNSSNTMYTFSGWIYTNAPKAELSLFQYTGTNTGYNYETSTTVGAVDINKWIFISKTIVASSNIRSLRLRICSTGKGNVWFDDVQINKVDVSSIGEKSLYVSYNTFKSPVQIEEKGIDKISFDYNDSNSRAAMFYGGQQTDKLQRPFRKYYSGDGTMEIKQNILTGTVEFVTYIGGDGYTAPVVVKSDGATQNYLYLQRDYQGSIVGITDANGAVLEKRLFDAWGVLQSVKDGAENNYYGLTILDRGYTGHEHLQSVGLINMNGRLYDPKVRRFLQPDNFIQDPANTQNYNRYGYVLNNPLKYTDPSGEEIVVGVAIGIGVAVAALTYTITALVADVPFTITGLYNAAVMGAVSSGVTFGIGSASASLSTNFFSQATFQAVAHGAFQGGMTAISGGKFWSGFASGALSSIAAGAWSGGGTTSSYHGAGSFAGSGVGMIAFGTVSGGAGAALTGGNFWQGAVTGLVVSWLNHEAHEMDERKSLRQKIEEGGLNPDAKPEMTSEFITGTLHKKVDGLQASYEAGEKPSFLFSDGKSENVAEHNLSHSNKITIYEQNAKTLYRLVSSLFHEYRHAYQVMTNMYSRAQSIYGPLGPEGTYSKLRSLIEWDAYNYQIEIGGEVDGFIFGQRDLMRKYFEGR